MNIINFAKVDRGGVRRLSFFLTLPKMSFSLHKPYLRQQNFILKSAPLVAITDLPQSIVSVNIKLKKKNSILEISSWCSYRSVNLCLKYFCSRVLTTFTKKDCKNVTTNEVCKKIPNVKLRNLPRLWEFYTNLVHMVFDIL